MAEAEKEWTGPKEKKRKEKKKKPSASAAAAAVDDPASHLLTLMSSLKVEMMKMTRRRTKKGK